MESELVEYARGGRTYVTTPQGFISTLTYANYRHNRQRSPAITPEQWQTVYGDTTAMERQYQQELATPSHVGSSHGT